MKSVLHLSVAVAVTMISAVGSADCTRDCTAYLKAVIDYKPRDAGNTVVTTRLTLVPGNTATRTGRHSKDCSPKRIHEAKEKACAAAADALKADFVLPAKQMDAVCVARSEGTFFKDAEWYQVKVIQASGTRDNASRTRDIVPAPCSFSCDGKKGVASGGMRCYATPN